jgi:hypothetical protein
MKFQGLFLLHSLKGAPCSLSVNVNESVGTEEYITPVRTLDIPLCSISLFSKPNRGTKDQNRAMWDERIRKPTYNYAECMKELNIKTLQ